MLDDDRFWVIASIRPGGLPIVVTTSSRESTHLPDGAEVIDREAVPRPDPRPPELFIR